MTARVTKQTVTTGYVADPEVRVSTLAIEVIRSVAGVSLGGGPAATKKTVIFVASS